MENAELQTVPPGPRAIIAGPGGLLCAGPYGECGLSVSRVLYRGSFLEHRNR